jgi:hypothetical protein
MRSELAEVYDLIYFDRGVELLAAHRGIVEALQMYHEDSGKPKDRHVLREGVYSLALFAFESALFHLLRLYECLEAGLEVNYSRHADTRPGKGEA